MVARGGWRWLENSGFQWPYRISGSRAVFSFLVISLGMLTGASAVASYYKPMEPFYKELEEGKTKLFLKYKQRFDDIKAGRPVEDPPVIKL